MKLNIELKLDNAAFDDCTSQEVARILINAAIDIRDNDCIVPKNFRDLNGNPCGFLTISE